MGQVCNAIDLVAYYGNTTLELWHKGAIVRKLMRSRFHVRSFVSLPPLAAAEAWNRMDRRGAERKRTGLSKSERSQKPW